MFLPCPSVRPWGSNFFFCLRTRFMGFWEGLVCFWRFRFLSVCACVRACVTLYVLSFVDWTCPRVLVRSTWNLFRSTIYELKLCTSYFWSTSLRPSVRPDGRNIAPDSILVINMIFMNVLSWTYLKVLVGSIWNLHVCNIYGLKLCPTPWGRRRIVRFSARGVGT